ncbi:MAG: c-type cytochrome [Gammaproteobacteria bacterium]|nr:c-type cytochrome [Gammaproteobacteria bacterium]
MKYLRPLYLFHLLLPLLLSLPATLPADSELDSELARALALEPDLENGRQQYLRLCAECHGEDGWGSTGGEYPQLAGQHRGVIIKQLADIRAGNRDNPKMFPIVEPGHMGGAQAIADIAAYTSSLLMDSFPAAGEGDRLEEAALLYRQMCARCHGANGEGDAQRLYPLIQGQHYEYLLRQLLWIRDGQRRNANPDMAALIRNLRQPQLEMLADYISRQMPPAEKIKED